MFRRAIAAARAGNIQFLDNNNILCNTAGILEKVADHPGIPVKVADHPGIPVKVSDITGSPTKVQKDITHSIKPYRDQVNFCN